MASRVLSMSSCMVSTATRTLGASSRMRRVASMPSITGIDRSISTTWGCRARASATASSPEDASPTTLSPADSNDLRSPSRSSA